MNVLSKVQLVPDAAKIAHSIMIYDRIGEELHSELPIPMFLDTLALKIAKVPQDDKYGALSYRLEANAVETFRFLIGLDVDVPNQEYFLESTVGHIADMETSKLTAVELLTRVTPRPRYARTKKPRVSERELVFPTLRLLENSNTGWMATSDLITRLTKLFTPSGKDASILEGRTDSYFSQKVRNMISHRDQSSSFIRNGLAHYERSGLQISREGRSTVQALLA